ncbi:MAG: hypothetical protein J5789_09040 [Oscillospiraceae bacterium]|nr:hypothetical protein [Oscillospiraceae bacterium]
MYRSAKQSRSESLSRKRRLIALTAAVSLSALLFTACDSSKELQLEERLESTDAANIRSAYFAVQTAAVTQAADVKGVTRTGDGPGSFTYTYTVEATQKIAGWQNDELEGIGGISINEIPAMVQGETWDVVYDEVTNNTTINAGSTAGSNPVQTTEVSLVREKDLEATDAANIRSAYAVIQTAALMQDDQDTIEKNNNTNVEFTVDGAEGSFVYQAVVKMKQTQDGWQSGAQVIGGFNVPAIGTVIGGGTCTIVYDQSTNATTLTWG